MFINSQYQNFTRPSLLTTPRALVLKVGVSCEWKMANCVASYSQEDQGKAVLAVYIAAKDVLAAFQDKVH